MNILNRCENSFFLVKFGQFDFMRQFQKEGMLYMNSLKYFRDLEEKVSGGEFIRSDKFEGVDRLYRHDQVRLTFEAGSKKVVLDKDSGLIGSLKIGFGKEEHTKVFCMYSIVLDGNVKKINPEIRSFGDHAVLITNQHEFMRRIQSKANELEIGLESSLVEYIDINMHHGNYGPFRKPLGYKFQSEYRIITYRDKIGAFQIKIGDISDISVLANTEELINTLEIQY